MRCSDDDGRPAGFCLISTPLVRMIKNTLLNQIYICSIGADVIHDCVDFKIKESKNEDEV